MKTEYLLFGTALGAALLMRMKKVAISGPLDCPPTDDVTGERLIDRASLERINECVSRRPSTKKRFTNPATGDYYQDRKEKVHKKIIERFLWRVPCVNNRNPIAVFMGGPPGAGKSTYLKNSKFPYINYANFLMINADDVRELIPEYEGWNASEVHEEASDITSMLIAQVGQTCRQDLIWDGTMGSSEHYIQAAKRLRGMGYKVYVIYLTVPKEVSIERAVMRYKEKGRNVPLFVIEDHFSRGLNPFYKVIPYVDGYKLIDGNTNPPKELQRSDPKKFLKRKVVYQ